MIKTKTIQVTTNILVPMRVVMDVEVPENIKSEGVTQFAKWVLNNTVLADLDEVRDRILDDVIYETVPQSKQTRPITAYMDEDDFRPIPVYSDSLKQVHSTDWPLGKSLVYEVILAGLHPTPADTWLFEIRSPSGDILAQRIVHGRKGMNDLYVDIVGYRPDEDEFQPDILKLRDGVLEMFYRFVTNDPN